MTSSLFQISRLKTVSKRLRRSFSVCVSAYSQHLCLCWCVSTAVGFLCSSFSWHVCTRGVCFVAACVFLCLWVSPHLCSHKWSVENCSRFADRCIMGEGVVCFSVYVCLSLEILLHHDLFAQTSKYCERCFYRVEVIFLGQTAVNWWLSWIFFSLKMLVGWPVPQSTFVPTIQYGQVF